MIGVERLVAEKGVKVQPFDQCWRTNNFTALAGMQGEAHKIAERIRERQHFRRQAAF